MPPEKEQTAPPELGLADVLLEQEEPKSEMDKAIQVLLDPANIGHLSEMSQREITAYSVLHAIDNHPEIDLPMLHSFLEKFAILRVSKSRQGRKEFVKILSRHIALEGQEDGAGTGGFRSMFRRQRPRT